VGVLKPSARQNLLTLPVILRTLRRYLHHYPAPKNNIATAIAHLLPMLAIVIALTTGCRCTAISNHEWAGHYPPKISRPEDIADNLIHAVNHRVKHAGVAGFFTVPFKRIGIFGWSDLGYDGEVTGVVQQTSNSTDQFYTVDLRLNTLQIDGKNMPLTGKCYLRAEVCLCEVTLSKEEQPKVGETVWIRGRMVWDGDGFVEIHPRSNVEIKKLPVPLSP